MNWHADSLTSTGLAGILAIAASACALTSKAELTNIRYFSPERLTWQHNDAHPVSVPAVTTPNGPVQVRLGRVSSGANLRERIAYRDTAYELGYYEDLRWTERPETYVRRELGRALFATHLVQHVLGSSIPTLDVEVIAFDDLRLTTGRAVRVQLSIILYDEQSVLLEDTLTTEQPVIGNNPLIEDMIAAMGHALEQITEQIAVNVKTTLLAQRPVPTQALSD